MKEKEKIRAVLVISVQKKERKKTVTINFATHLKFQVSTQNFKNNYKKTSAYLYFIHIYQYTGEKNKKII